MEFPDLGEQCSLPSCRQLDFLPFKCDACSKMFCLAHRMCADHNCPFAQTKIVPTCPLCQNAVPIPPGESADSAVTKHIDNKCDSDVAKRKREKIKANRCSYKGCRNKDEFRVTCDVCQLRYCLIHRHGMDHACPGPKGSSASKVCPPVGGAIPLKAQRCSTQSSSDRNSPFKRIDRPTALRVHSLQQPGLSEDEALKRAIEMSLQQQQAGSSREGEEEEEAKRLQDENDEALARALQEAEFSQQRTPVTTTSDSNKQNCCIS